MRGKTIKTVAGLSFLALLLGGLCLLLFSAKPERFQTIHRPDGSTITLSGVTYGTNHTMIWGKPYQRALYKILPQKLKYLSGATVAGFTTSQTNMPVFWLYDSRVPTNSSTVVIRATAPGGFRTNLQGNLTGIRLAGVLNSSTSAPGGTSISPDTVFRLLDEYGCVHRPQRYSSGANFGRGDGILSHYQFNAGDPHCKIIGICVYDGESGSSEIGRFLLPGAVLKSLPKPAKESLPAPQHDGEMTFELTSLVTGLQAEPFSFQKMIVAPLFTRATFRIAKNGAPMPARDTIRLKITDANGKKVQTWSSGVGARQGDDDAIDFQGFLDPTNGPYKIHAEFIHRTGFSSNELVTFTNVPFPADSESLALTNLTAEVSGHRVTLETFYGKFSERPQPRFSAGQPVLLARLEPADAATHLQIVSVLDERNFSLPAWGVFPKGNGENYFSLAPNTQGKSVTLTFAAHRSRFADFEAMPTVLSTNSVAAQK